MRMDMCIGMCADMRADVCTGMCTDMRADVCTGMCTDMHADMCAGMCTDMECRVGMAQFADVCIGLRRAIAMDEAGTHLSTCIHAGKDPLYAHVC